MVEEKRLDETHSTRATHREMRHTALFLVPVARGCPALVAGGSAAAWSAQTATAWAAAGRTPPRQAQSRSTPPMSSHIPLYPLPSMVGRTRQRTALRCAAALSRALWLAQSHNCNQRRATFGRSRAGKNKREHSQHDGIRFICTWRRYRQRNRPIVCILCSTISFESLVGAWAWALGRDGFKAKMRFDNELIMVTGHRIKARTSNTYTFSSAQPCGVDAVQ
jgi:hypothetical protein